MPNKSGYCSYCCVHYQNMSQHLVSPHHRYLVDQKRQSLGARSLMERFLQDVICHHPHHAQRRSRSIQNETPMGAALPSQLVPADVIPEEVNEEDDPGKEDDPGIREERPPRGGEPNEELDSRPSQPQESVQNVSVRPSVIQKLEKGQQQPLNLVCKSGDGLKEFNPVGVSQTTKNRQNIVCPSVNSNVPAGHLLESSNDYKSVTTNTTKLPHLESVSKHDPNKVNRYFEGQERGSRNTVLKSTVKISPVLCQKYNESDQKSVSVNSEKLIIQGYIKPSDKTLSTGLKSHESVGAEGFSKYESLSKLAVNPSVNQNKNEMPSQQGIFEDSIPKHSGEFSKMYCVQEEEHLVVNQSAFLEQKHSAGSEMKFQSGQLQASSDQPEENVPDLEEEKIKAQGNNKNALGGSEMSVDYRSPFNVLTDQSEVMARETNLSKEVDIDLQDSSDESDSFEISSDDFFQLAENQSHADVKDTNIQKAVPISLVDESYNSSDSEINLDCDASLQPVADCLQKPTEEENLSKEVYIGLVDKNYGSGNSEISAGSASPLQSVVDQLPVVNLETKPQKYHIYLVDKDYGSSSSEASFDDDISLKSILDPPKLTVKENNLQVVYLEDKDHDPGSAEAHLGCDISLEIATDEPQKADKEVNLLEENDAMEINPCGFQGLKIDFHAHVVADHSQVTLQGVDPQEVAIDLENKDNKSSASDLSFASNMSLYQSTNGQPQEILSEDSAEESDIDMEVKSVDCSSSDLTFDSDPPYISAAERSELDIAGIMKKYKNLEDKNNGSDSSELTFDSDFSLCSVDQCQVAVYEEKPIDPESKGNEPCVSEINFDSDMPLHSGNDQPAVTLKKIFTQKKEYAYSESIHGQPSDFEMQWESPAPSQSVTNLTEVAVKRLDLPKEEQTHSENKKYESSGSELNLDCNSFDAMTEHSEGSIKYVNIQKRKYRHLENKDNEPSTSKIGLKSDDCPGLVTGHLDITAKVLNQKEEPACSGYKNNRLGVSEPSLYPTVSLPSLTHRPGVVVKEIRLQKEKHSSSKHKMAEFSDPEINSDFESPHCSVNEPHKVVKEINVQKEAHAVSNKSVICRSSEIILDPGVPPQFMTEKPQIAVLQKGHVDVGDDLPESRGFEIKLNDKNPFYSVINQPKLTPLKEVYIDLEDTDSESSESNIHFHSMEVITPLKEQFQEADSQVKPQKAGTSFGTRMGEVVDSKLNDSDVSLQTVAEQPEVGAKRFKLENQSHVYLGDKTTQYNDPNMNLNSNFLVRSTVGQPSVNILGQEQIELEEKHQQFCDSEVSFDSDGSVQLVADQLRETVQEICLRKDPADGEDNTDAHKDLEILYESGAVFPSVSSQPEDIHSGIHLWKKHTDVEDITVEPRNSEINVASTEPVQFVTNEFQENITELNRREGQVFKDAKGYKLNDSEIIYISSSPLPSITEHRQSLEEAHGSLGENDDLSGPKIHFAPDNPLESVTDHLQRGVTEVSPWKEGHIYLEDTGYRFGNFEVNCDSDTPIHFVTNTSVTTVKEINLQRNVANDLADKNSDPTISEIKCNSGVCLQLKVDEPQLICNEIDLEKEELGVEEKTNDSEIMCDSDTRLQIVLDQDEVSVRETNLQKMVVMDLVTGDSDCEVISDSETVQPVVIDSPPMTVQGVDCINTEHFELQGDSQEAFVSELTYPCEASGSGKKKSKDTFKVINQKKDYIILQESSCESYGSEMNFQMDPSPHTITCETKEPSKKKMKYSDPENKKRKSKSPKTSKTQEDSSQSVAHQQQKADKRSSFRKDGVNNNRKKNKKRDSSVCKLDSSAPLESTHDQNVDKIVTVQLKHLSPEPLIDEPNFQTGNPGHSQRAVNKGDFVKKMCYTLKERKLDSQPSTSSVVESNKTPDPVQNAIEDESQEPVLEASPHVPASFVGKTLSQIRKEEDLKINALVKEFREGRFHCYFDDDCETQTKKKKKKTNKGKKVTWADLGHDTASGHILSANDSGVILEINDFSVAFDKFSHSYPTKMPYDLPWQATSRCQTVKLSHGTQTSLMSHPGTKRLRQAKDSPKRKQSHLNRKRKKRVKTERLEFPQSCNHVLKPLQPNALLYILSSNIYKVKEEESLNLSRKLPLPLENNGVLRVQYKLISFGCDTLNEQFGVKTPSNADAPQNEGDIWVNIHFDGSKLKEEDNDDLRNPVKDQLVTQEKEGGDCVSLVKPESLNSNDVPKGSNFQLTLPDGDATQISPMSAREKNSESKKKIQKRKSAAKMSVLAQKACQPILLQPQKGIACKEHLVWIRTTLNDIFRKYITKYSVFLLHKYQFRSTSVRPCLSKNSDAGRSKKPKRETQKLLNPVPSGAEKGAADAGSPLK